jgi:threonine/homoserine/homoserine lactone efflux protein
MEEVKRWLFHRLTAVGAQGSMPRVSIAHNRVMTPLSAAALFSTMLLLAVIPGPSDVVVLGRALSAGLNHAFAAILGIVVADAVFIVVAVLSLNAVLEQAGSAFYIVRLLGACFVIWIGLSLWRTRVEPFEIARTSARSWVASFSSGLLITFGDPKAILFYMGLLPAFLDMSSASLRDTITVLALATLAILAVKGTYAVLADHARSFVERPDTRRYLHGACGAVLIAVGLYVLLLR